MKYLYIIGMLFGVALMIFSPPNPQFYVSGLGILIFNGFLFLDASITNTIRRSKQMDKG